MCPFAQKAWIALEVANVPYEMQEISLYGPGGKPDWFWQLNPQGTVPVLQTKEGTVLADSDDILDYCLNQKQLNQTGSGEVASSCKDIEKIRSFVNRKLLPTGKQAVLQGRHQDLKLVLQDLESDCGKATFLAGESVSVADCHAFPFVWRIDQDMGLDGYPNLKVWLNKCATLPEFKKTIRQSWWWWW